MLHPWWLVIAACVVITALMLLVVLVLAITQQTVDKARPEDLPAVLAGIGDVAASLACFLPWGKLRESPPSEATSLPNGEMPPSVTIVAGQLAATPAITPPIVPGEVNL